MPACRPSRKLTISQPAVGIAGPGSSPLSVRISIFSATSCATGSATGIDVMVKMVEKQWFNGIRLSPHIFNTEADVDAALAAIRTELRHSLSAGSGAASCRLAVLDNQVGDPAEIGSSRPPFCVTKTS